MINNLPSSVEMSRQSGVFVLLIIPGLALGAATTVTDRVVWVQDTITHHTFDQLIILNQQTCHLYILQMKKNQFTSSD